jgi:hypothetical protein
MCGDDLGQGLAASLIVFVKARQLGAVEIENANDEVAAKQRDDQFRTRRSVAGNVTREGGYIGHKDRPALGRCCPTDPPPKRNSHAGRTALERTHDQFCATQKIEAGPVQPRQRVVDCSGCVGGIGHFITLVSQ